MRTALKQFRIGKHLTQAEMAEKCGVSRITYSSIENGKRSGKYEFWRNLQQVFNVPNEDVFLLQKVEEMKEQGSKNKY